MWCVLPRIIHLLTGMSHGIQSRCPLDLWGSPPVRTTVVVRKQGIEPGLTIASVLKVACTHEQFSQSMPLIVTTGLAGVSVVYPVMVPMKYATLTGEAVRSCVDWPTS